MNTGSPWLAIVSLVLGAICALALFDESDWGRDSWVGFFALAIPGLVTGIAAVKTATTARGVAIAGIVLSSISLFAGIGNIAG
jgi:ABC-type spermidine/putrescine transport system permease subunit II